MTSPTAPAEPPPKLAPAYLLAALLLHAAAAAMVLRMAGPQRPADTPPVLSFRMIETAALPEPDAAVSAIPPALVAKPVAEARPRHAPPPRLSAPAPEAQAPALTPWQEAPAHEAPSRTEPVPQAAPVETPAAAPASARATHAQTAPRFDADYLDNPPPAYPALARRTGEEGKVVLRVFVEASGRPGQVQIHASSGSARLDQAAQESVARWTFVPAQRGGEPVGAWVLVPIQFSLRS